MGEFGRYYEKLWGCGMWRDKALEAVARERLKAAYAIMLDQLPYLAA